MANRSTRNKLRYQADKTLTAVKKAFEHMQGFDEMADGRSDYITTYLPMLVKALLEWEKGFQAFRNGL